MGLAVIIVLTSNRSCAEEGSGKASEKAAD